MNAKIQEFNIRGYDRATDKEVSVPYSTFWDYRDAQACVLDLISRHPDTRFELVIVYK